MITDTHALIDALVDLYPGPHLRACAWGRVTVMTHDDVYLGYCACRELARVRLSFEGLRDAVKPVDLKHGIAWYR